ncbi:hypothetical protein N7468_006333 [Penicillium chermesinum]|uniref:Clr5 domain-containing protein n=1 Tax=Penicillium chermesinum TaxID=63820 RepID=A0A9W9TJK0_9EURO|nr:uncharacterized protein N7468_006333 [Penicillium chermesinum]KAJ5225108.1 hypothetical protein N7468_006333 [Penicillium chermesinum]KAJ6151837.1 hypothetical protein N7470_006965 [Penicillium chermesinum]
MKTSISSDVWEKKKALIAKLYMEEEWPLKQVIKQIRSDDFNPSETQLRSRLKKWRVTKPSRQCRKKPSDGGESEKEAKELSKSPLNRPAPVPKQKASAARPTWLGAHHAYSPHDVPQLTPSPSGEHVHRASVHSFTEHSSSFEQPAQSSPPGEGLVLNTTSALASSYPGYPLSPDSCIPSPGPSTTSALPVWQQPPRSLSVDGMPMPPNSSVHSGQWYSMPPVPFEPVTPPSGIPHSAPMPPSGYHEQMPMIVSAPAVYSPDFVHHYENPEYHHYDPKPWKRPPVPLHYDYSPHGHPRLDHSDRKPSSHAPLPPAMVPVPGSQSATSHPMMCAPVSYMS